MGKINLTKKYTYSFPTTIRFGAGVIDELADYLKANHLSKPLVVSDAVVTELPFFKKIIADLKAKKISTEVFKDMHKNPVKSDVIKGTDVFKKNNCDCVI